jgi:WD40 repeat protein
MLTADDFRAHWSYSLAEDFVPSHGRPLVTSTHFFGQTEDQSHIPLRRLPTGWQLAKSVNADESLLAVAVDNEIDVYHLHTRSFWGTLRGHIGCIETLIFHPLQPLELVSGAGDVHLGKTRILAQAGKPEIIFWNLSDSPSVDGDATARDNITKAAKQGVDHGLDILAHNNMRLTASPADLHDIQAALESAFTELWALRSVPPERRHVGRLLGSFQSPSFSPDGKYIIILPGERPKSNSDDKWDMHVLNYATRSVELELSGHRDAIMWAGFSPDQKRIGSCAWDGAFRIWNAADGSVQHIFKSDTQTWAAAFSPDSTKFLGSDGHGTVQIWELSTGEVIWKYECKRWARYLDWSPDGSYVAIGIETRGKLAIFDVQDLGQKDDTESLAIEAVPAQTRSLSTAHLPEKMQMHSGAFLTIQSVRFLALHPQRLVYTTTVDQGIEIYDIEAGKKWRLAPSPASAVKDSKFPSAWEYLNRSDSLLAITETGIYVCNISESE